jgi:cation diffusion facilitator CzcD-associated flavoprotein CzcO
VEHAAVEHLDVLIVGAGLSGIGAAHHVQTSCPWASWAIFEARDAIGGTWDLFTYPGIRSDSDMYTLGYSFRPWDGEESIADGASILRYIKDTAAESGIDERIRFGHRIVAAAWSTDDARWHVTAERTDTGETVEVTAGFVFSCTGYYRYDRGYQPDFAGMDDFAGTLVHPQHWPDDLDVTGRRVVVIGSGATAVTLIPSLAQTAEHVTMLQRSPTYIASLPSKNPITPFLRKVLPKRWSDSAIRWVNAVGTQAFFQISKRRPQMVKKALRRGVSQQLPEGYDVETHFTPTYDPWDQRLCVVPNGDLFTAIREGRASVVTDHIETFTPTGVRLVSGAEIEADVIVTATGLDLLFLGGMDLTVDGEPVVLAERLTYKGMMLQDVPNLALAIGYTNASWTLKCDLTCGYVCRLLNHMRASGLRQATPRNDDPDVVEAPLLGLSSGYVQRSAHLFPKQGSRFPWQVHQSYLRDYRAIKMRGVVDDAMVFSNPAPGSSGPSVEVVTGDIPVDPAPTDAAPDAAGVG